MENNKTTHLYPLKNLKRVLYYIASSYIVFSAQGFMTLCLTFCHYKISTFMILPLSSAWCISSSGNVLCLLLEKQTGEIL